MAANQEGYRLIAYDSPKYCVLMLEPGYRARLLERRTLRRRCRSLHLCIDICSRRHRLQAPGLDPILEQDPSSATDATVRPGIRGPLQSSWQNP
jgi:hypothetical protein